MTKQAETRAPRFNGLRPASTRASTAARGASRKKDTTCELRLRRALWKLGVRYRVAVESLPGKPDIVIKKASLVVFCDGDFWHGRELDARLRKLGTGHNGSYWTEKIRRNVERDRRQDAALSGEGWTVIRLWETDILRDPDGAARLVVRAIKGAKGPWKSQGFT